MLRARHAIIARAAAGVGGEPAPDPEPGAPAWSPLDLGAALVAWFDATDASTMTTSGSRVTAWADKSPAGLVATAPEASALQTGGSINGVACLFSQERRDDLEINSELGAPAHAVMGVFENTAQNGGMFGDAGGAYLPIMATQTSTNVLRVRGVNDDPSWGIIINGEAQPQGVTRLDLYNASLAPAIWGFANIPAFGPPYCIGRSSSSYGVKGPVGDAVILSDAATLDDRQRVEGYLAHKYGLAGDLPADHPYKTGAS